MLWTQNTRAVSAAEVRIPPRVGFLRGLGSSPVRRPRPFGETNERQSEHHIVCVVFIRRDRPSAPRRQIHRPAPPAGPKMGSPRKTFDRKALGQLGLLRQYEKIRLPAFWVRSLSQGHKERQSTQDGVEGLRPPPRAQVCLKDVAALRRQCRSCLLSLSPRTGGWREGMISTILKAAA